MRWFVSLLLLLTGAVSAAAPQTQTFADDLGRTVTVPLHPQRIVSMHDLDITIPLIELGAPPIASHGRTRPDGSHYLRSSAQLTGVDFDNSDIRFIGTADIDLEAVAAARPDLIITEPSRHVSVEQLEKIAPTVSIDHLQGSAPEIYRKLAQLTGTQPRLAILERRYQEQITAESDGQPTAVQRLSDPGEQRQGHGASFVSCAGPGAARRRVPLSAAD